MKKVISGRAGSLVAQPAGYSAFIPRRLPPDPAIEFDGELVQMAQEAADAVGRLDGVSETLPDPDLFVAMYVRKEAVLSSQIEGTQSSLEDVLEYEAGLESGESPPDVADVYNYVRALNHGLGRLKELPLSLRLLSEIHAVLMEGIRGGEKSPGEFRTSQNWVGPQGAPLSDAVFVPPPPYEMKEALGNLETYLHEGSPSLVAAGVAHCQFETIHPFLDGNGRLGRLLITFMLCERGVLRRPLLYLSHYLKKNRQEYYDRLMAVRQRGDWEGWLRFFLRGVAEVSREATETSRAVTDLRARHQRTIRERVRGTRRHEFLDLLFRQPYVNARFVEEQLRVSYGTANNLIGRFVDAGILEDVTDRRRNRWFAYQRYVDLFTEGTIVTPDG